MDRDMLGALDANYLEANRIFVSGADAGEYTERRDVAIVCCGLPAQALNFGFLRPPYGDLDATATAVRRYFGARKLPHRLSFRDETCAPLRELEAKGWRRSANPAPGMTLPLPSTVPEPPAGLAIEAVRSTRQLEGFREAAFVGFGFPAAVAPLFMNERLLAQPQVHLYAGRIAGAVVATSMIVTTGPVAGIYWVATLEAQRGRGYGAALTWAAVAGGQQAGCSVASLQASPLGQPVYARMGFAHVLDYEHLLPPEE